MTEEKNAIPDGWPPLPQIVFAAIAIGGLFWFAQGTDVPQYPVQSRASSAPATTVTIAYEDIIPSRGVRLPVRWDTTGAQLVATGVIDEERFLALYDGNAALKKEAEDLLNASDGELVITRENAPVVLNVLWALGLAQQNPVLDSGEMMNPAYGGAENFASTGGWTMAKGGAMEHYSRHRFFDLTPRQQMLVEKVSQGIYRPCCGNSTHFPDCNHGMAMLGLLELMASQGAREEDMWKAALAVNSYWFPDTYVTISAYLQSKGISWEMADPREVLGASYSSAAGYADIEARFVQPELPSGGNSCSV